MKKLLISDTISTSAIAVSLTVALVVLAASLLTAQDTFAQFQSGGVDKEGTWHAGEGLKQGDYFSYLMCYVDYKECAKFRLDLWIKGDMQVGSETKWLAETVVYDGNRIIVGNMELGKIAPEPTGGSDELGIYRGAFKSSIVWLSAFATADHESGGKGPKAFTDTSWGKIGTIGGEQVMPRDLEQVTTADRTWETVVVGWRTGGAVSNIWIVDDFPFPVKAKTFTHVSEGIPPREYEFILLDYKENVQKDPFADVVPTSQLLAAQGCDADFDKDVTVKKPTVGAMYQIYVAYGPEEPQQGCNMQWIIKFISKYDETEFLNQVQFDVLAVDENFAPTRSLAYEEGRPFLYSPSGQYLLDLQVQEGPGVENYVIWIYGRSPENIVPSDLNDYVEIPITIIENDNLNETPQTSSVIDAPDDITVSIPDWIKQTAGWWAAGDIDDTSFVQAIQYLINQGIILIPPTTPADGTAPAADDATIPSWIKTNAEWWSQNVIDDNTFVQAIQYLIQTGIMVIS